MGHMNNMIELIKTAVKSPCVRAKLVSDSVATCNQFGIKIRDKNLSCLEADLPTIDLSNMQGRFRP